MPDYLMKVKMQKRMVNIYYIYLKEKSTCTFLLIFAHEVGVPKSKRGLFIVD
jgi:hypothetical protein